MKGRDAVLRAGTAQLSLSHPSGKVGRTTQRIPTR